MRLLKNGVLKIGKNLNYIISILLRDILRCRCHAGDKESKILADQLDKFPSKRAILNFYWDRNMAGKSIKAISYIFEKTRKYLTLNYKYPEFSIGYRWVLRARCGYKFDARVAKAAKMIEEDCPERCPCCYRKNGNPRLEHWFSKCYLFRVFRIKYFKDIDILYKKFYIISKYCSISNSNVDTVITDINNNKIKFLILIVVAKYIILIIITIEIILLIIVVLVIVKIIILLLLM